MYTPNPNDAEPTPYAWYLENRLRASAGHDAFDRQLDRTDQERHLLAAVIGYETGKKGEPLLHRFELEIKLNELLDREE